MELIELTGENIEMYLKDCLELQAQLVSKPESIIAQHFVITAESSNSYFLGVIEDEQVIAMGVLSLLPHPVDITGYVNNIVVDEKHRGKGIFGIIMDAVEEKAKNWGCTDLALTCSRPAVQGLYEKRGYRHKETKFYLKDL